MAGKKSIVVPYASTQDVISRNIPSYSPPEDPLTYISTGCDLLDWELGGQGFPSGSITEYWAVESGGKTQLALQVARSCLWAGGEVLYMDNDNGLVLNWPRKLGIDPHQLNPCHPVTLEETLSLIEAEVNYRWQADTPTLIVWDCISATQPKMVVEEKIGEKVQMCRRAAMLSEFFAREWMVKLGKSRIVLLMTNQLRDHPGVMYGEKEGPPGGKSIRYAARIRMRLDMAEDIPHPQEPSLVIGRRMNITIVKNKYTGRRNTFGVSTYLDRGIDNLHTSLAYAYDEHGTPQGRLHYQGKQWFRKELHLYLCEHPTEIDPFREHVRKLWMGETPSDD